MPYGLMGPWVHGPIPPGQISIISAEMRRRGKFDKIDMADKKFREKETVQPEICETRRFFVLPKFGPWLYFIWYVAAAPKTSNWPQPGILGRPPNLKILLFQQKLTF